MDKKSLFFVSTNGFTMENSSWYPASFAVYNINQVRFQVDIFIHV